MKKLILFLSFIIGMMMNAQVSQTQVFASTEEISFVSDNGNGTYTVSGPGAGDDGFLAIYDEGSDSWEYKSFPAKTNIGSVHDASVKNAFTFGNETFATGVVAVSTTSEWRVVRKYVGTSYSVEKIVKNTGMLLYKAGNDLYGVIGIYSNSDLLNTGWNLPGEGMYLVKFNKQDLSLDWSYRVCSTWNPDEWVIVTQDVLISTNIAYRYAVQQLPNGSIAVTVSQVLSGQTPDYEYQLWEFDPNTGQKLGVIDDSYTDYDRNGAPELQYRFHRWKVVDGVLFHEFWNDPAAYPDDQQIGHWEKLEVPGYTPGSSGHTAGWTSANLQVTAVSDWESYDSFGMVFSDFSVESDGTLKSGGYKLSPKLEPTTGEDIFYGWNGDIRDSWVRPNGDLMAMGLHGLYRFSGQQYTAQPGLNATGTGVMEAHEDELYEDSAWIPVTGEGALVLSSLPSVGSQPDSSWWTIPAGYHDGGHTAIMESHRPGEEGQLFFRVAILADNNVYVEAYRRITLYDTNQVSVPETEISGLSLYPNPVENFLTVSADDDIDTVRVYNMSGIMVKEADGVHSVFVGDLPTGVYIVEVTAGEAVSRRKMIKK